ncbi:MAG: DUF4189 domain-containing protein [Tabrizicola sp.]
MQSLPRPIRLAALGLAAVLPTHALAYYPCNGPGPDEVMIGIDNSAGYDVPLCEYVGPPDDWSGYDDGGGGGGYWVDQYAVLVWGNDANGTPTYTWTVGADSQAAAEGGAMRECANAGYANCRPATWVVNGAIAIAVDNSGSLHSDQGPDAAQAKKKALRACKSQGGKGCKVERVLESLPVWVNN